MQVREVAELVKNGLASRGFEITVAGSIRRKVANPRDVDVIIVINTEETHKKFWDWLEPVAKEVIEEGERIVRAKILGVQVDFYFCYPEEFGAMLLFLTGSQKFNVKTRGVAKRKGYKLNQYGLWKKEVLVESKSEEVILAKLGMLSFLNPETRSMK